MQQLICKRLGIREAEGDPDVKDLMQDTAVENLVEELGNTFDPSSKTQEPG